MNEPAKLSRKQLFRKKPVVIEAVQWHKHGDHPEVRRPRNDGTRYEIHESCGIIDTLEGKHEVSPGDWIIKGVKGEFYACKPDIFAMTYETAESAPSERAASHEQWNAAMDRAAEICDAVAREYGAINLDVTTEHRRLDYQCERGARNCADNIRAAKMPLPTPDAIATNRQEAQPK